MESNIPFSFSHTTEVYQAGESVNFTVLDTVLNNETQLRDEILKVLPEKIKDFHFSRSERKVLFFFVKYPLGMFSRKSIMKKLNMVSATCHDSLCKLEAKKLIVSREKNRKIVGRQKLYYFLNSEFFIH